MNTKKIVVRPAGREDAALIAEVVCMAVGYDTARPIYPVFLTLAASDKAQYSYRNALIAEVDGTVAGAIVGYDGAMLYELREPIFPLLEKYLGSVLDIEDETAAGEFYLDSLGVLPQFRGMGVGAMLLNAMSNKAFAEGHTRVGLIVDFDNPRAERLYTELGFVRVGQKRFLGHDMWHLQKFGEAYAGDTKFVARCRQQQSRFRAELGEPIRPYKGRTREYYFGNYIAHGEQSGKNFLEDYIFEYATERVRKKKPHETINSDRLFNNLLSSQPMAFNLFCPLRRMLHESEAMATSVIRSALSDYPIARVTEVDLEFIPDNYKSLTNDRSAMDAIIRFDDSSGRDSFIAIETKYSENLGINEASKRGKKRAHEIIRTLGCFRPEVEERIECGQVNLTQIYRNFLLSEAHGIDIGAESYSLILSPEEHPSTVRECASLTCELRPEYSTKLRSMSLEAFVRRLIDVSPEPYATTFKRFYDRYLIMRRIKITVKRITEYRDLMAEYENPIEHACDMQLGQTFIVENGHRPEGMCDSAWETLRPFVEELARGGGNFFDGWMKNPQSAMLSCNDGFRPVSFYVEVIE